MITLRKKQFCEYYLENYNQTDAARKAGYKSQRPNGLTVKASKLMRDPDIIEYIDNKLKVLQEKHTITQNQIIEYLSGCILGTEKEKQIHILKSGYKGEYNDELIEKETDLKAKDRIKAAEVMAKIYKLMDHTKTEEPQKVIIQYDIPDEIEDNE